MQEIDLEKLKSNPKNPRKKFKGRAFDELVASIKEKGVLQPILIRPQDVQQTNSGDYETIAGERRVQAARKAGLKTIPAIVKVVDDQEAFDLMTIENLQREDLTALQEAKSFAGFIKGKRNGSVTELAQRTGLNHGYIRKRVKIVNTFSAKMLTAWDAGEIKIGHLEQLIRVENKKDRDEMAKEIMEYGWNIDSLKRHIENNAPPLSNAKFDKTQCATCFNNSIRQKSMFDLDLEDDACCLKPACYKEKLLKFFTAEWPKIAAKHKLKTNGFEFEYNLSYSDYEIFYQNLFAGCAKCEHYKTMLTAEGNVHTDRKRICVNPKCFHQKSEERRTKDAPVETKTPTKNPDKPRVAWHGEHFREEFYKDRLPEKYNEIDVEDEKITRLALAALLQRNYELSHWFDEATKDIPGETFEILSKQSHDQLKQLLKEATIQDIMSSNFSAFERRDIADHLKIDLSKEWKITEEYLQKKTKPEMIKIMKDFNLDDGRIEDFKRMKKKGMIASLLSKKLDGVVPKEILS